MKAQVFSIFPTGPAHPQNCKNILLRLDLVLSIVESRSSLLSKIQS